MTVSIWHRLTPALGLLAAFGAAAQEEPRILEEIVVTAAYREQGLMEVPVSVSAVTGDQLTETALQKAEDIQFLVPNFTLTETGISTNISIRGINSGINQAFEQSVGTYIDGVHLGRGQQFRSPFLDIERVEVLRGPQSILFGKNSVAGAMNITTAKPTHEFEGRLMASQEFEHDELIAEAILSGPLSDRVRGRIAARVRDLSGHMENITLNRNEPQREDWTLRGTLEVDVTDSLMATLKVEQGEFDVVGRHIEIINEQPSNEPPFVGLLYNQILALAFFQDPSVTNVVQDERRSSNGDFSFNEIATYALTLDWEIGEHDLKSITAYSTLDYDEFCDCDFTAANVFGAALQEKYDQISQELRLSSPLRENFDYILGVYYQTSDHDYADQIIVDTTSILIPAVNARVPGAGTLLAGTQAARTASVESDVISAFAQFNWHLSDNFTLQLGGRVTKDDRDGMRELTILQDDFSPLTPAQLATPLVYANPDLFSITSTNLIPLTQFPVPQISGPANALVYGVDMNGIPCTSVDPDNCFRGLGVLPVSGSRDTTKFSPEVKLVWNPGDTSMLYLSWADGFKSGSFDFRANNKNFYPDMATSFEFDDEEASNIELGGKFTLAGGVFELNAAVFYTEFDNLQISIFDGVLGFNVGNAASAEIQGVELDWRWAAGDYLTVTGGIAFTDFEFTDFRNGQCYVGQAPNVDLDGDGLPELCDYTGQSNLLVSDVQGNVSFDFRYPFGNSMEFRALLDVFYTGDYDATFSFDPALKQDAYSLVNLRLAVGPETGDWEIAVLGKNLGDEKALTFGGDTPLAGSSFGAKSNYAFYNPGTTVSLQGMVRF